jgi:hypothetical protein
MRPILLAVLLALPSLAWGQAYKLRVDPQFTGRALPTLTMLQGADADIDVVTYENGSLYTNLGGKTATFKFARTATNTAFLTATNTSRTIATGTLRIPLGVTQTGTNGTFWYTAFVRSSTRTWFQGTGTVHIIRSGAVTASTASGSISLDLPKCTVTGTLPYENLPSTILTNLLAGSGVTVTGAGYTRTISATGSTGWGPTQVLHTARLDAAGATNAAQTIAIAALPTFAALNASNTADRTAAQTALNLTNGLLSARITTAQARADAAGVTNAAQTLALAGKQDSSTAATDAELAAAATAGTNNTTAATNAITLQEVVTRGGTVTSGTVTIDSANARTNTFGGKLTVLGESVTAGVNTSAGLYSATFGLNNTSASLYGLLAGVGNSGNGHYAFGGGWNNTFDYGAFGGGVNNVFGYGAGGSGFNNTVGTFGFGAGYGGKGGVGSFVFSDYSVTNFFDRTEVDNEFAFRCQSIYWKIGTLTISSIATTVTDSDAAIPTSAAVVKYAPTIGQLAATGAAVRVYCSNAANLTGPVPDASISTNTPSASSGMLLAWDKAQRRFWKWINMLRNSAGAVALDATTAGVLNTQGNIVLGGTGTNSYITIQGTSGNGTLTLPAFQVAGGNNGATKAITVLNNGNVGLGTTSPDQKLQVMGTIKSTGSGVAAASRLQLQDTDVGGTLWQILNGYSAPNTLSFFSGSPVFNIHTGGNVGLGTNAPTSRLHVVRGGISQLGMVSNSLWAANQTFPAGQLANNVPYANVTNALARARAPQAVTYTGTNVYTDARIGTLFRISATNDFRLHKPTGAYDGQGFLYWIKQATGGTNTGTMTTGDFVPPVGSSTVVLSVTNGCVDQFVGIWDASINKVRIGSFMRYME